MQDSGDKGFIIHLVHWKSFVKFGKMQHKTDLIRDALNLYLSHHDDIPGTRAAITRKLEGRLDAVEEQLGQQSHLLQQQNDLLEKLVAFFKKRRGA